jgi:hypothetical protein
MRVSGIIVTNEKSANNTFHLATVGQTTAYIVGLTNPTSTPTTIFLTLDELSPVTKQWSPRTTNKIINFKERVDGRLILLDNALLPFLTLQINDNFEPGHHKKASPIEIRGHVLLKSVVIPSDSMEHHSAIMVMLDRNSSIRNLRLTLNITKQKEKSKKNITDCAVFRISACTTSGTCIAHLIHGIHNGGQKDKTLQRYINHHLPLFGNAPAYRSIYEHLHSFSQASTHPLRHGSHLNMSTVQEKEFMGKERKRKRDQALDDDDFLNDEVEDAFLDQIEPERKIYKINDEQTPYFSTNQLISMISSETTNDAIETEQLETCAQLDINVFLNEVAFD